MCEGLLVNFEDGMYHPSILHCVSENLEEVARRQHTNFAFESAGFAFLSSVATSPKGQWVLPQIQENQNLVHGETF